jgi:hypothetical protein
MFGDDSDVFYDDIEEISDKIMFIDYEANYGDMDEITDKLMTNKIPYDHS